MLDNIRIVLLHTTHPGNIGATARAMKNMGVERLCLVAPRHYPNPEANSRASSATDILDKATICETLDEAIADCQLVIGTSARKRSLALQLINPRECSRIIERESSDAKIAILFGEERIGLTNEQIDRCHYQVMIPTSGDYYSLNLAAAVQIICYELQITAAATPATSNNTSNMATDAEMEGFYQQLQDLLIDKQFLDPSQPKRLMSKLRRLFTRARPRQEEINILRGILTALTKKTL